jgi:putative membrane protein
MAEEPTACEHAPVQGDSHGIARLIFTWVVNSIALGVAAWLVGQVSFSSYLALAGAGLVFAVINTYVKPVLVLFGFPLILITLGIFLFLINMFMIWVTAWLVPGFAADGFWQIAKATVVVWFVNMLLSSFWPKQRPGGRVSVTWVE